MNTEQELKLTRRVLELIDLRDKLLDQNKSYRDLAMKEREHMDEVSWTLIDKIVTKHKTIHNILGLQRTKKIDYEESRKLLLLALRDGKQFTEAQVLKELGR